MSVPFLVSQENKIIPLFDSSNRHNHIYLTLSNKAMNTLSYHSIGTETHSEENPKNNKQPSNTISSYSFDKLVIEFPKIKPQKYYDIQNKNYSELRLSNSRNKIHHNKQSNLFPLTLLNNNPDFHIKKNLFNTCCNISVIKEKAFDIKNFMLNNRNYSQKEKECFSEMDKNELRFRSPGKGMYLKINKYRDMIKYKPFHLTERSLLPSIFFDKKQKENKEKSLPPVRCKIEHEKVFKKDNEALMQFRHLKRLQNNGKKSKVVIKSELVAPQKRIKKNIVHKMRDQEIYKLILQNGDEKLKHKFACYDYDYFTKKPFISIENKV